MKKILFSFLFIAVLLTSKVEAQTIKVVSMEAFSTEFPSQTYTVKTLESGVLPNGVFLYPGTIIYGKVVRIQSPKRGKRNSYIVFRPISAASRGKIMPLEHYSMDVKVVGYKPINPKRLAIATAKKATNLFFMGASVGISFVEGVAKAEDGSRIKSGLIKSYEDSPLSYIEEGQELNVGVGDTLVLQLKNK